MLAFKGYERERALAYARRYALSRNPLFYDFAQLGGDCTSFVSQCVLAGCCVMNFTPDFGWYYRTPEDRAPAFTGVEEFWQFMTGAPAFLAENGGIGPFGEATEASRLELGDVIQLGNGEGEYYHTLLLTGRREGELLVSAHTRDALDRPLSSYEAPRVRFLHLIGARFPVEDAACFEALLEGRALPSLP